MGRKRIGYENDNHLSAFDRARDELFSHILNCGVLEADSHHRKEWFDDTLDYLGQRHPSLSAAKLATLRELGERFCQPVISDDRTLKTN